MILNSVPVQVAGIVPSSRPGFIVEVAELHFEALLPDAVPSHLVIIDGDANNINLRAVHDAQYKVVLA